jgi:hypothetical protein
LPKPSAVWNFGTVSADLCKNSLKQVALELLLVIFFNLSEDLNELEIDRICRTFFDVESQWQHVEWVPLYGAIVL